MALVAPRLDDRSFQDLVDDAKRFIQERCPEWSDHNVSDPGITLVEAFAWMTDLLLYRLNRVPDRLYVKFLDLLGVSLFPPTAARVDVDFRLSAPQATIVSIPAGTVVATARSSTDEPVTFTTTRTLDIVPSTVELVGSARADGELVDLSNRLGIDTVTPFADPPVDGDALYVGFAAALPGHTVLLTMACEEGRGHGIEPDRPPLRWEALTDDGWRPCDVARDDTLGLNVNGHVELHIPAGHVETPVGNRELGLVRCRVVSHPHIKPYTESPGIRSMEGSVVGGTAEAINAETVDDEVLGESSGVAGQEFPLARVPVIPSDEPFVVHVSRPAVGGTAPEIEEWEIRANFADSAPDDHHFTLDRVGGIVRFGPTIREEDGSSRNLGAAPPKGALLTVPRYRYGGGAPGNVAPRAISVLRSSIPFVASVSNRRPAKGGVDGETVTEAKVRGPVQLRTRNRAVTAEDFEALTREAAPDVRRVRCIADTEGDDPAGVRILIVPAVEDAAGRISLEDLLPSDEACATIQAYLDERRLVGTRVRVEPAQYTGIRIQARITAEPHADPAAVAEAARTALYRHFNPLVGGDRGEGWPFGRGARVGEAYGVLQRLAGLDVVESLTLLSVDLETGEAEEAGNLLELYPNELVLSHEHDIEVTS
jgi:predicted phage baseplate assembly protein